jgi:hypothetical protein
LFNPSGFCLGDANVHQVIMRQILKRCGASMLGLPNANFDSDLKGLHLKSLSIDLYVLGYKF